MRSSGSKARELGGREARERDKRRQEGVGTEMEKTVWIVGIEGIEGIEGVKWRDEQTSNVYCRTNQMVTQSFGGRKLRKGDTA